MRSTAVVLRTGELCRLMATFGAGLSGLDTGGNRRVVVIVAFATDEKESGHCGIGV